jgi:hypothetical protein
MPLLRQSRCSSSRWGLRPAARTAGCCALCWPGHPSLQPSSERRLLLPLCRLSLLPRRLVPQTLSRQRLCLHPCSRQFPSRQFPTPRRPLRPRCRLSLRRFRLSYWAAIPQCEFAATSCRLKRHCRVPRLYLLRFPPPRLRRCRPLVHLLRPCKPPLQPCKPRRRGRLHPALYPFLCPPAAAPLVHGRFLQRCLRPRQMGGRSR